VELSHEAIWIHKDGIVLLANDNAARMFGFSNAQDMIGRQTGGLVHPGDRERAAARTSAMLKRGGPAPLTEMRFLGPEGRTILLEIQATPFEDRGSASILAVGRDITDRRRLEDQLRHAQKLEAIGQLTGGIAHDFNNLLSVVIGNLDSVLEDPDANTKHSEMIRRALDGALHGAELTHRLLGFARRLPLEPKVLAINGMLPDVVTLLKRTLGEAISVELKTSPDLWPALADASQLQDALLNLAINARDAMPQGGRLTIETANAQFDEEDSAQNPDVRPGPYAMLAVTDTGSGMAPEVLKHVMEPFFTTKPVGKGTGLGLSMIYGFAQQSGGHLKIYSEMGRGTTVRLYLPKASAAADRPAKQSEKSLPRGKETILVVEDNPALRKTAIIQLSELGYQIVEAASGEEAVSVLRGNGPIDLVFSDIVMTGKLTGADVAREAERLRPSLRVLLSTGYAERSGEIGERHWPVLNKPYRKRELATKVREILDEQPAAR
jgi:PAS domain S-box-containing protein